MKTPVLLLAAALLALLSPGGPAFSGHDSWQDTYGYPFDAYSDPSGRGVPSSGYRDWTPRLDADEGASLPANIPEWYPVPPRIDPAPSPWLESYTDRVPGEGPGGYLSAYGGDPYREGPIRWQDGTAPRGDLDLERFGVYQDPLPAAARGYRFRGDEPTGFGRWDGSRRKSVYQFRPLTKEERKRMGTGTAWRSRKPTPSGVRPGQPEPVPTGEAYGYARGSWLDRYFGERY